MPAQVLGVGWDFPVALQDERIAVARYEGCVRHSILLILSTARGERVMRPDFGCGLHELVFNVNGPSTQGMAEFHVREALKAWE
ncbi:GPW/gp25 family protein, partial [Caballeronia sp.]|uniref:GPW/gp25 family protein n=1 Tax=Caballeronia sp. TaxID=1931223 RepID=UPI003C4535CF